MKVQEYAKKFGGDLRKGITALANDIRLGKAA
jgi:hypothetical protein